MKRALLTEAMKISLDNLEDHPRYGGFAHFSFLVQNNKILEWSTNIIGTDEYRYRHAEVRVLRKARGIMSIRNPFDVINTRLNRIGKMRNSYPCKRCRLALRLVGCHSVWYTNDYGWEKIILCP